MNILNFIITFFMIMMINFKKIVSVTLLVLFSLRVFAPGIFSFIIIGSQPEEPFQRLIDAIGMVETKQDTLAYNPVEQAVGYFQIRPIRLEDYNARTGNDFSSCDLFNYEISEKIFLYYASHIGPYDFESIARSWNGSGKSTIEYWNQVKKFLE
jgi:hypothetical protein